MITQVGSALTATTIGKVLNPNPGKPVTFEAYLDAVAGAASVDVYGTIGGVVWYLVASLSPAGASGGDYATPELASTYQEYRFDCTAISGGARVSAVIGY